jgi:hypothetical protein
VPNTTSAENRESAQCPDDCGRWKSHSTFYGAIFGCFPGFAKFFPDLHKTEVDFNSILAIIEPFFNITQYGIPEKQPMD